MIETIILSILTIYGIHTVVDNLLHSFTGQDVGQWWEVFGRPLWAKPIIVCAICMTSVWSVPVLLIWGCPTWHLIPSIFAVAGGLYIMTRI